LPRSLPVTLGGYIEGYRIVETDRTTAQQRPAAVLDLQGHGVIAKPLRLFVDVRGMLGGTPRQASGFGVFNLTDTFQNVSPSVEIEEAYVDWRLEDLDVRLGKQRFAWGRLDLFRPTDVLNPRRYNDPFVMEDEDAKIGIPALTFAYYLPRSLLADTDVTVAWVPLPSSFRFPVQQERWFPDSATVPDRVVIPENFFGLGSGSTIVPTLRTENADPPQQLDEGALALRVSGAIRGVEWSLSYYDGTETAPGLSFATTIYSPSARAKIANGERPTIPGGDLENLVADATLRPLHQRIRLLGGDAAWPLGGFTARFEAAYGFDRLVPRSTQSLLSLDNIRASVGDEIVDVVGTILDGGAAAVDLGDLFVTRDRFEWGVGVDYAIDGWIPLLQVNQAVLVGNDSTPLLVSDTDTRILLALRKHLMNERLTIDLVGFQGIERSYSTAITRFSFAITDQLRLRFGYVLIAGTRQSVIGQYQDLDEAFFQVRYSF